jgi:hypothetical protein
MTHLSPEELRRWWEEGAPADRERVIGHLAACDQCAALYERLIDERPLDTALEPPDAALIAAGRGVYRRDQPATAATRPARPMRWIGIAAAAAAVLVLAVQFYGRPDPLVPPADETVRSTAIQPLSPDGAVSAPFVFAWSSPVQAPRYELTVRDGRGMSVWTVTVEATRLEAPAELLMRLASGEEHTWQATAINLRGERTVQSPPRRFVVRPRDGSSTREP